MKVSVIIPVYKVEQYLEKCVESVLAQSWKDIEVILVDDGSPDGCPAMCDAYQKKDPRVVAIHKENGGLSDARNVGLLHATGDYIVFLDSDDFYVDLDAISGWVELLEKRTTDVLMFRSQKYYPDTESFDQPNALSIDTSRVFEGEQILSLMENGLFQICAWDKVVARRFLIDHEISFVKGVHSEDMEWCIKLLLANARIGFDPRVCHGYRRQNQGSLTKNVTQKAVNDVASVIKKYASEKTELNTNQKLVQHFVANIYVQWLNLSTLTPDDTNITLLEEMRKYQYLLQYRAYPYVKKAARFRFLGYNNLRRLLNLYYRYRNRAQ